MSRYAKRSQVPQSKTRMEIETLLEKWGCSKVGILADHETNEVEVQFFWKQDDRTWAARFSVNLAPDNVCDTQRQQEMDSRGKMRALLYYLRSAFSAVDVGIITAEQVFLPWLVTGTGETVGQALLPKLRELAAGSARALLGEGK